MSCVMFLARAGNDGGINKRQPLFLTARDVGRGQAAVVGLKGVGLSPLFHQLDITDPASVRTARDFFKAQYGGVDVLINYSSVQFMADTTPVQSSNLPIIKPGGNGEHFQHDGFHLGCCSPDLQARLCSDNKTEEGLVRLMERFVKDAEDSAHSQRGRPNTELQSHQMRPHGQLVSEKKVQPW
uniref:Carbonyl reductase 1 n=1 Tax=Pygocentrus nattereri TaxID=42514 RepID=A0A3B4EM06_PYGNA